jgi:poly(3-hydroxybutyrate) depolymerase
MKLPRQRPAAWLIAAMMATMLSSSVNAQTIGERMRARREARQLAKNSTFPPKGDPSQARTVWLTFDGVKRSYLIAEPRGLKPFPVVVLLHGGTQDAEQVWRQTSLPTLARSEGFILVAPNALNKHWNDGRGTVLGGEASSADDVGFLKQIIADVVADDGGKPERCLHGRCIQRRLHDDALRLPGRKLAARSLLWNQRPSRGRGI